MSIRFYSIIRCGSCSQHQAWLLLLGCSRRRGQQACLLPVCSPELLLRGIWKAASLCCCRWGPLFSLVCSRSVCGMMPESGGRSGKSLLFYLFGSLSFIVTFVAYLVVKSGDAVDLRDLIVFQQVFALTGFGMIPMPAFPHYWAIHAAIIFSVLFIAALRLSASERRRDRKLEFSAAYVAILGVGLTVYYVGRSHILVLRLVIWPSVLLLFFLLDRSLGEMKERRTICSLLALLSVTVPATFFLSALPGIAGNIERARSAPAEANKAILADIGFIRERTIPGEPVAIVSVDQGVLYGQTGTKAALSGPGVAELIRRADLDRLMDFLVERGPEKLFIGTNLEMRRRRA